MTNLQLHSKREPQLALPSSVAEANSGVQYTGMLKDIMYRIQIIITYYL